MGRNAHDKPGTGTVLEFWQAHEVVAPPFDRCGTGNLTCGDWARIRLRFESLRSDTTICRWNRFARLPSGRNF